MRNPGYRVTITTLAILSCTLLLAALCAGCGAAVDPFTGLTISPGNPQVRTGETVQFVASTPSGSVKGGSWSIKGTLTPGTISAKGVYVAPAVASTGSLTVTFSLDGDTATTPIVVLNPVPVLASVSPSSLSGLVTTITATGTGFLQNSAILCDGKAVPTQFIDNSHVSAVVSLPADNATQMTISVQNPDPGAVVSAGMLVPIRLASLKVSASAAKVRPGETVQVSAFVGDVPVTGGTWAIAGPAAMGMISQSGLYTAPPVSPAQPVNLSFTLNGSTATTNLTVLNPVPQIASVSPTVVSSLNSTFIVTGSGFVVGSLLEVNGNAVPATLMDANHLKGDFQLPDASVQALTIAVSNPDPGAMASNVVNIAVALDPLQVSPATLSLGAYTLKATLSGIPSGASITVDGAPLSQMTSDKDSISGSGWLPPWRTGSVHVVVLSPDGTATLGQFDEPITPTAVSFDAAARFAKQAGFGPRPDVVLHIQQVGFEAFLNEQFSAPVNDFHPETMGPIHAMYLAGTTGASLLRLRTAWGLQTYMPGQMINEISPAVIPWEQTLERDAFSNYRDLLRDTMSDPNIGTRLTIPGNVASTDPEYHPNQNFGRELMQLFSLGMYMLKPDGTEIIDTTGRSMPAYSQDDVLTMSRVFTGWNYAPPVNPLFTSFGIDYSQSLIANDSLHDHDVKLLFNSVTIPAGLSITEDREAALDALMQHPSIAPFVSRLLIQRFVTGQPSPEYISRISAVFRNNGSGVEGDMKSIIKAILMDPEARAGDTGASSTVGVLQDPITAEMFLLSTLQISSEDDQPVYVPKELGEGVFDPPTIFGYFSPSFTVPGTQINSPEFELYDNFSALQRMQSIYGVTTLQAPGYNNGYQGWLFDNFHTPASMLEAVNHLLLGGTMPIAEQDEITRYAQTIQDPRQQLESIVFLALISDNYTVVK